MSLSDTVKQIEEELAALEGQDHEFSKMRRIVLNNAMADCLYGVAEILKEQGKHEDADKAHAAANKYWSAVCEEAGVYLTRFLRKARTLCACGLSAN